MNLNSYQNLVFILAGSVETLSEKLNLIKTPFKVVNVYHDGVNHVCWILPDRKLTKSLIDKLKA